METDGFEQLKNKIQEWLQEAEKLIHQIPQTQLYAAIIHPKLYAAIGVVLLTTPLLLLVEGEELFFFIKRVTWIEGDELLPFLNPSSECTDARLSLNYDGTFVLHSEMSSKKEKIKPVNIVDGHSCLQPKLDEFLPQAAGMVFIVDALEFLPNCRAASEYVRSNSSSDMLSSTCFS
ncbi:unnamed protein product [Camellia sinensis]